MSIAPDKSPPSQLPGFAPTPEQTRQILHELDDPAASIYGLANRYKTDQESFCLWLARPEIAERVNVLESTVARRNRYVASNAFNAAVQAATRILYEFNYPSESRGNIPCPRETALRAARFLLRISQFAPGPVAARAPRSAPGSAAATNTPSHAATPAPQSAPIQAFDPIEIATQHVLAALAPDMHKAPVATTNSQARPLQHQSPQAIAHNPQPQRQNSDSSTQIAPAFNDELIDTFVQHFESSDEESDDEDNEFTKPLTAEEAQQGASNLIARGILTPAQAAAMLHEVGHTIQPTHPP